VVNLNLQELNVKEFRELSALGTTEDLCHLIDELAESGSLAIPLVLLAMQDRDDEVRCYAVRTLSRIGVGQPEVAESFAIALKDHCDCVRRYAAAALGVVKPLAAIAKSALTVACNDEDYIVRYFASQALSDLERKVAR